LGHDLIGAMQRLARARGYALLVAGGEEREMDYADLDALPRNRPDGFLFCGSDFL
jgi:DNA-binding LacI/PurR family transcriptional regulator